MPSWNDLGTAFSTLRELDVNAIREEAERQVRIVCIGPRVLYDLTANLLTNTGGRRHGPAGGSALSYVRPEQTDTDEVRRADLLLILLDGREPLPRSTVGVLEGLARLALPTTIVLWHADLPPGAASEVRPIFAHAHIVGIADPQHPQAPIILADAITERLPGELHLSAARSLPGLRPSVARQLVNTTSFTNASYALASALPEQIPILSIPFAAADILVLTKNQALMVYKLGLAHGAPPEFTARIREVLPVIGGAYAWRQLARTLVGLIPVWGIVPKVAIAYAGTYSTGVAAWRWFADGELISGAKLKDLYDEAIQVGRARAHELVANARQQGVRSGGFFRRLGRRVRALLPGGRKSGTSLSPAEEER